MNNYKTYQIGRYVCYFEDDIYDDMTCVNNCVYEIIANDGCSMIGFNESESLYSRIEKYLISSKKDLEIRKHIDITNNFTVHILYTCSNPNILRTLEQFAIYDKICCILDKNNISHPYNVNVIKYIYKIKNKIANRCFDSKYRLISFLANPSFNIYDYAHNVNPLNIPNLRNIKCEYNK